MIYPRHQYWGVDRFDRFPIGWRKCLTRRRQGCSPAYAQGRFVAMLADKGSLGNGLAIEQARDVVWTLCSLAVHDLLIVERGWSSERYQGWLTSALTCALLPEATTCS